MNTLSIKQFIAVWLAVGMLSACLDTKAQTVDSIHVFTYTYTGTYVDRQRSMGEKIIQIENIATLDECESLKIDMNLTDRGNIGICTRTLFQYIPAGRK